MSQNSIWFVELPTILEGSLIFLCEVPHTEPSTQQDPSMNFYLFPCGGERLNVRSKCVLAAYIFGCFFFLIKKKSRYNLHIIKCIVYKYIVRLGFFFYYIHLCNHHPAQDKGISLTSLSYIYHHRFVLFILECHRNRIVQCILLCLGFFT